MLCAQCRDRRLRVFASVFVATGCAVAVFLTPLTAVVSLLLLQQLLFRRLHNRVTHLLYGHLGAVD